MIRNTLRFTLAFVVFGLASTQALAQALSCDSLAEVGDTATEVRDALYEIGTITEGDEVDMALDELIDGLWMIAEAEGNDALEDQIDAMTEGWEEMDGDLLMSGLQGAINSVDTLLLVFK
jgi:hypothetical protein